ncbi:hypothetical protein RF11_04694 [Thelohanellus kitauei]|uniref:Uncharacterized protein n=1 Tax=Thelohanellus kitauei TaxID=669202 RepID=A0A0C2NH22_THEKT|nr:hypothetical protein RF11_04694 [Thelohanellus kitauei]
MAMKPTCCVAVSYVWEQTFSTMNIHKTNINDPRALRRRTFKYGLESSAMDNPYQLRVFESIATLQKWSLFNRFADMILASTDMLPTKLFVISCQATDTEGAELYIFTNLSW